MRRGSQWARSATKYEIDNLAKRTERGIARSIATKEENERKAKEAKAEAIRKEHEYQDAMAPSRRITSYARCFWCGLSYGTGPAAKTKEHLIPKSKGGRDCFNNIVWAHQKCNTLRGSNENWIPFHVHGQEGKVMWK